MRNLLLYMSFLFLIISFLSCSQPDDFLEDYLVVYEHTVNDTISKKDSTSSTDTLVIVADSTSHNDSIINADSTTQSPTIIKKDTLLVSYEKYMDITTSFGNEQGGACYDKYFFQGYANNAALGVFDLEKKTFICKIDIPEPAASANIHVNTINFGSQRMYENDYFPLLYVSSGYTKIFNGTSYSFIYVYRINKEIINNTEHFRAELVQTISLNDLGSWTEGITDNDHNILWIKFDESNEYKYASFTMPKCTEGNIVLDKTNILQIFSLGFLGKTSNQGHIYKNNRILLVSGISPYTEKLAFIVINTLTQSRELVIDLAEIGLTSEPENVFFYKDQLMIGYRTAIYKFNVRPLNNN